MVEPGGWIVQLAAKMAIGVDVDETDGQFSDTQAMVGDLDPELQRHGVARLGQV